MTRGEPRMPAGSFSDGIYWLDRRANRTRTHLARRGSLRERQREELLRDWYGPELAREELLAHTTPAQPLSRVIATVFSGLGKADAMLLDDLRTRWPGLVGPDVARQSRPVSLQKGVLDIEVDSAPWRYVLEREHKTDILGKVREASAEQVSRIRFVPRGRYGPGIA